MGVNGTSMPGVELQYHHVRVESTTNGYRIEGHRHAEVETYNAHTVTIDGDPVTDGPVELAADESDQSTWITVELTGGEASILT